VVPFYRALVSNYRLSIKSMSLTKAVRPQCTFDKTCCVTTDRRLVATSTLRVSAKKLKTSYVTLDIFAADLLFAICLYLLSYLRSSKVDILVLIVV